MTGGRGGAQPPANPFEFGFTGPGPPLARPFLPLKWPPGGKVLDDGYKLQRIAGVEVPGPKGSGKSGPGETMRLTRRTRQERADGRLTSKN